jgi:hypothetical protein
LEIKPFYRLCGHIFYQTNPVIATIGLKSKQESLFIRIGAIAIIYVNGIAAAVVVKPNRVEQNRVLKRNGYIRFGARRPQLGTGVQKWLPAAFRRIVGSTLNHRIRIPADTIYTRRFRTNRIGGWSAVFDRQPAKIIGIPLTTSFRSECHTGIEKAWGVGIGGQTYHTRQSSRSTCSTYKRKKHNVLCIGFQAFDQ